MPLRHLLSDSDVRMPRYAPLERWKIEASLSDKKIVFDHISDRIRKLNNFSIMTEWPSPWPDELESLWHFFSNENVSAVALGCLVIETLLQDERQWRCFKTDIADRGFETNYYWVEGTR